MINNSTVDIYFKSVNEAIVECEQSLPRDQYCDYKVETFATKVKDKQ